MTLWQVINFITFFLLIIFCFNFFQSLFIWVKAWQEKRRWDYVYHYLHLNFFIPIKAFKRYPSNFKRKIKSKISFRFFFYLIVSLIVSYQLFFDVLKLVSLVLIRHYSFLIFPGLALSMLIMIVLSPFIIIGVSVIYNLMLLFFKLIDLMLKNIFNVFINTFVSGYKKPFPKYKAFLR